MDKVKKINTIGISGKANSGKDTVANIITYFTSDCSDKSKSYYRTYDEYIQWCNRTYTWYYTVWEKVGFADRLKEMAAMYLGIPKEEFENRKIKEKHRPLLQFIGNKMREYDPDFWIKALFNNCEDDKYDKLIITDVRYLNEVEAIHDRGGIVIRIEGDRNIKSSHQSEIELDEYDGFDWIIINNKPTLMENLIGQVKGFIDHFGIS